MATSPTIKRVKRPQRKTKSSAEKSPQSRGEDRAALIPISITAAPMTALAGLQILTKSKARAGKGSFVPIGADGEVFDESHRRRLIHQGVHYIYIPASQQGRFHRQIEESLLEIVADSDTAPAVKAEIIYHTAVEIISKLLSKPDFTTMRQRLERISQAVVKFILSEDSAFANLFAASHHDFHDATHMVNIGIWMTALAHAVGRTNETELCEICQAGMIHDLGKFFIAAEILNRPGGLSNGEWDLMRQHPHRGLEQLGACENVTEIVKRVMLEHHERMDGSGYPSGLSGEQIHLASRLCAVVDSFDAMTAVQPYKPRPMTVAQAVANLVDETPAKYDQKAVEAWIGLLIAAESLAGEVESDWLKSGRSRRAFERFRINSPAEAHLLHSDPDGWTELAGSAVIANNLSRTGVGLLSQTRFACGDCIRVYLMETAGKDGFQRRFVEGVVIRSRESTDGWHEIGIKLGLPA